MRVLVKQSDGTAKELQFTEGPISIGRGTNNRVFLPDKGVSREHAIIRDAGGGKWVIFPESGGTAFWDLSGMRI